jgi:hypothetical protein
MPVSKVSIKPLVFVSEDNIGLRIDLSAKMRTLIQEQTGCTQCKNNTKKPPPKTGFR